MAITIALKRAQENDDSLLLFPEAAAATQDWPSTGEEGRLAIDVFETDKEIIIRSAIAGVKPEDIDVTLHNDMLTIRGMRQAEAVTEGRALVQECHWGAFSRSVILPAETDADRITAALKDGILTVSLPKILRNRRIGVRDLG